jgi:hypothetical protein
MIFLINLTNSSVLYILLLRVNKSGDFMKHYISEDVKQLNTVLVLKAVYQMQTATMNDIIEITGLSQSTVRSILIELEAVNKIVNIGKDASSGGRCPNRYTFHPHAYCLISVYLHRTTAEIKVFHVFYESVMYKQIFTFESVDQLTERLCFFQREYMASCISFGVEGIIEGHDYYTDHYGSFSKITIISEIKEQMDIPVYIENDVNLMMLGYKSNHNNDMKNIEYLYLTEIGLGSAFLVNDNILYGKSHYAGEIGLIPYGEKSINKWLQSFMSDDEYVDIVSHLLTIVSSFLDPDRIVLSGEIIRKALHNRVVKKSENYLNSSYQMFVEYHEDNEEDIWRGLQYKTIMELFENGNTSE